MKHFFSTIIVLLSVCIIDTNAQVTITQADFPREAGFTDEVIRSLVAGVTPPSEGANQTWNYSNLVTNFTRTEDHFDATNSTDFPDALNYYVRDFTVLENMPISSSIYEGVDSLGWYGMGIKHNDITYPLEAFTGTVTDSLRFVGGNYPYEGRTNILQFPATYLSQQTNTRKRTTPVEITVAAFGLDKTPGSVVRSRTQTNEVVGFGTLVLPRNETSSTVPMDVLLVKRTTINTDSFFLAGAPAPGAITTAFGITQGLVNPTITTYLFYRPGYGKYILGFRMLSTGQIDFMDYHRESDDGFVSTKNVALAPIQAFPNPITAGQMLTLSAESTVDFERISFYDVNGRLIENKMIIANSATQIQVETPSNLSNGLYFYTIRSKEGTLVGNGKLLVK